MDDELDIERLAAPIDGGATAAGEDPRLTVDASSFFTLKDLRAEARTAEREAAASPDAETPVLEAGARKWRELSALSQQVLETQAKDLEIASWLCEAQARLDGFQGVASGLDLIKRLLDRYWDEGLYPSEDEDGVETRIAPIGNLLGLSGAAGLLQPIKLLPISDHDPDVALWSVEAAMAPLQGASDDPEQRERAGQRRAERQDQVRQAVSRASPAFLKSTHAAIGAALTTIAALSADVDAKAQTGPFGSQVTEPLRAILAFLEANASAVFLAEVPGAGVDGGAGGEGAATAGSAPGGGGGGPAGPGRIGSREDAYAAILRIADYFASTEPQSIVARSLREVVRRARMPLDDLLSELLPDAEQRHLFLQRAGVKPPSEDAGGEY